MHFLFMFLLSLLNNREALQAEDIRHSWKYIFNQGTGEEVKQLRVAGVAQYFSTTYLVMPQMVSNNSRVT